MQTVAMGWLVLELGGTPFDLGLINFAQLVPILALGVVGGAVSDRVNKRWLLIAGQSAAAIINLVIALLTLAGQMTIPTLIVLAFLSGLASPFIWPAFQAIIRELVGPDKLRTAIALNAGRFNLARILGPTIAGGLVAIIGTAGCLIIGSIALTGVVLTVWLIRYDPPPLAPQLEWVQAMTEGLQHAWRDRQIRAYLLAAGGIGLLAMPYQAFIPAYSRDVLSAGPEGLGLLLTAVGIGALVGAVSSGFRFASRRPLTTCFIFIVCLGIGLAVYTFAGSLILALVGLTLVGLGSIGFSGNCQCLGSTAGPARCPRTHHRNMDNSQRRPDADRQPRVRSRCGGFRRSTRIDNWGRRLYDCCLAICPGAQEVLAPGDQAHMMELLGRANGA